MEGIGLSFEKWKAQNRKGFLELCLLALVDRKGKAYGLDLQESLASLGIGIAEGTLYPILMRMTGEGSLAAEWEIPDRGHPRKYYRLSPAGRELLAAMSAEYEACRAAFRSIAAERRD